MAKMKWPKKEAILDRLELTARRAYECAGYDEDSRWYSNQRAWIRKLIKRIGIRDKLFYGDALDRCAGVVAVLSPQVSWESQRKYIPDVLADLHNGAGPYDISHPGFDANRVKAHEVFNGNLMAIKGDKVTAFWHNLMGADTHVTVDSQILDAALGCTPEERPGLTPRRYKEVAEVITTLSTTLSYMNLTPPQMQAMIWGFHRRNK